MRGPIIAGLGAAFLMAGCATAERQEAAPPTTNSGYGWYDQGWRYSLHGSAEGARWVLALPEGGAAPDEPAGGASPPPQPPQARIIESVDLLPLLNMTRRGSAAAADARIGGYTRFVIEGRHHERGARDAHGREVRERQYHTERRHWLARWLAGRSLSRVLLVKATVSQPSVAVTTTLASATHQSNRVAGEAWSTELHGQRVLTPYFRVDPNTTMRLDVSLNASTTMQGDVTGAVLGVMQRAVNLMAPTSVLATSLTADSLRETSDFLDQSVAALFSETISETSTHEFGPGDWRGEEIVIQAYFPAQRVAGAELQDIGTWTIRLAPSLVSIFSDTPLCAPTGPCDPDAQARIAFAAVGPQTVLGFRVDSDMSLDEALRADAVIAAVLADLNDSTPAERPMRARLACSRIAAKAEAIGFNRYDAAAAVWATAHSDMVRVGTDALTADDACEAVRLFNRIRGAG